MSRLLTSPLVILALLAGGCVSVSLGTSEVKRAQSLKITSPNKPFESISTQSADAAWKNPSSGSIISYLSACGDESDPSLHALRNDILRGLEKLRIEKEERFQFQSREALRSRVFGDVDGVTSFVDLVVFKKNSCNFVITLVSKPDGAEKDVANFDDFLRRFEVP